MNRIISIGICCFVNIIAHSQESTFFISNSNTPLGENYFQKASFCTMYDDGIFYVNNLKEFSSEDFVYKVEMVHCDISGSEIRRVDLSSDSLAAVFAWGDRLGDNMAIMALVRSSSAVYLRHRLYNRQLEVLEDQVIALDWFDQWYHGVSLVISNAEQHFATDGTNKYMMLNFGVSFDSNPSLSMGFVYDEAGRLKLAKHLARGFPTLSEDGMFYNEHEGTLTYLFSYALSTKNHIFDKNFNLLRTEQIEHIPIDLDTVGSI